MAEAEHYDIEEIIAKSVERESAAPVRGRASKERRAAADAAPAREAGRGRGARRPGRGCPKIRRPQPRAATGARASMRRPRSTRWSALVWPCSAPTGRASSPRRRAIDERAIRRYRAGELATTPEAMARARLWALETAARLLAAAGESTSPGVCRAREQGMRLRNAERARAAHEANVARPRRSASRPMRARPGPTPGALRGCELARQSEKLRCPAVLCDDERAAPLPSDHPHCPPNPGEAPRPLDPVPTARRSVFPSRVLRTPHSTRTRHSARPLALRPPRRSAPGPGPQAPTGHTASRFRRSARTRRRRRWTKR